MNTVPDALRSIAENIEALGHYQGRQGQKLVDHEGEGKCCLVVNPTLRYLSRNNNVIYWATKDAMHKAFAGHQISVAHHSNVTPTKTLVDQLRSLADDLEGRAALARAPWTQERIDAAKEIVSRDIRATSLGHEPDRAPGDAGSR